MQKCSVCGKRSIASQIEWIDCPECSITICEGCKKKVPFFEPLDAFFCSPGCELKYVNGVIDQAAKQKNLAAHREEPEAVGGAFRAAYYTPRRLEHKGHKLYFWMADGYPSRVKDATLRKACERFAELCGASADKK